MKILVCGSREWTNEAMIRQALTRFSPKTTTVIHGAARGADRIAGKVANELGFIVRAFPANWEKFGKAAGMIRNQQMLDEGKPDLVLAFHEDITNSKGTGNMVQRAREAKIPVD